MRFNVVIKIVVSFALVDLIGVPEFDFSVPSRSDDLVLEPKHHLDGVFVARSLIIDVDQTFDEVSFPKKHGAVFRGGKHLPIGESIERRHVWELDLAKFGDFAFEFQSREGLGNFPKSDLKGYLMWPVPEEQSMSSWYWENLMR